MKRTVIAGVGASAVVAGSYLVLLGWHRPKQTDPVTGDQTGPYHAWQVILVALVVALVAVALGRLGLPNVALVVIPVTLVVLFSADAATARDGDGLWPVGAALLAAAALAGTAVLARLGNARRPRVRAS
jgi:hypothetical protein